MDANMMRMLGYSQDSFLGNQPQQSQGLGHLFGGLPQPLTDGNNYTPDRYNAPVFSAGGLNQNMATPYRQVGGVTSLNPNTQANPGSLDRALGTTLSAGGAGWMDRGANAFLGGAFNPWTREMGGPDGESSAPANAGQSLDQLFNTAQSLGMDTSGYSRNLGGAGIRGERSGERDAMSLYDDLNRHTQDYVSVGGLSQGWSGGPANTASRTIYKEVDGKLLPVTRPTYRGNNPDNGFFSQEFKDAMMTVGSAALGGWMAAPAAAGSTAAGAAAGGTAAAGAAGGTAAGTAGSIASQAANALGLGSQWAAMPAWGQQALTGALRGGLTSAVGGGNPLQGALSGGLGGATSGMFNGIGGSMGLPQWASQGLGGALQGGLSSAVGNGNLLQGMLGGGMGGLGGAFGSSVDPRLAGFGRLAGRGLANLYTSGRR